MARYTIEYIVRGSIEIEAENLYDAEQRFFTDSEQEQMLDDIVSNYSPAKVSITGIEPEED